MIQTIAGVLISAITVYYLIPFGVKTVMRRRFLSRIARSPYAYLTFDDGPDPYSTPEILNLLSSAEIKATFFVLGSRVEKHKELVHRMIQEGHEVGEHSLNHHNPLKRDPWTTYRDLVGGAKPLDSLGVPQSGRLFRPPYGKFNLVSLVYVFLGRRRVAFWNNDPRDYESNSGEKVARYVMDHLSDSKVILLHDGRRGVGKSDTKVTVRAVELVIETAAQNSVRFAPLGELLEAST